jgi:hypothetical protein
MAPMGATDQNRAASAIDDNDGQAGSAAAFLAVGLFLYLNGHRLQAAQADATLTMLAVAAGDLSEDEFAAWLRQHAVRK